MVDYTICNLEKEVVELENTKIENFQRFETKFILSLQQFSLLEMEFEQYLKPDSHPVSTINNIYFDTEDFDIIKESLEESSFNEKIRIRSYEPLDNDQASVFLEIKKKCDDLVFKERMEMSLAQAMTILSTQESVGNDKFASELEWLNNRFGRLKPMLVMSYQRMSLQGIEDKKIRITVDKQITYQEYGLAIKGKTVAQHLFPEDLVVMEIKILGDYPIWLGDLLQKFELKEKSFSKYGVAYRQLESRYSLNR